jgi:starch synthase (maltosyl-transferring)
LDFAIQCSPDHPWLKEHPEWFDWRSDGSLKYAENPPKKYQDIVNVDFYAAAAVPSLWEALRDVVLFWADQGVRTFRVDNPHTKPLPFWQWMIAEVKGRYPDVIFLSEAFTRPKPMYHLAKAGFSQSYTYFTWRHTKAEFQAYLTELNSVPIRDFFRPHFFVNTPDINPYFLQSSGRAGFLIRAALAATLSGLFGVYAGFELCESAALPDREEYLDSEKFEIRLRPDRAPGDIVDEITTLNRIRREQPALQSHLGIEFHTAFNDEVLYFSKTSPDGGGRVLVAISLDPFAVQEADVEVPLWLFGLQDWDGIDVQDLIDGHRFRWTGKIQRLRLEPQRPYAIWRIGAET